VDSRTIQLQLVEGGDGEGEKKTRLRGEFARCGEATANKRVYTQKLWEREIHRLAKAMEGKQLYGELDHPSDGRTQLARVSHLLLNLEIKDGLVVGEAEVLDTERGRNLKAILQAGGRVGISSRGYGSTSKDDKGHDVVGDDYRLVTFDFVADPADQNAFPDVFYEHNEGHMDREDEAKMADEFARRLEVVKKEERQSTEAALREEFARETMTRLGELRAQVVEQVRGELLSDPAVGGSRTALDKIKEVLRPFVLPEDAKAVAEQKDAEIARLRAQLANGDLRLKDLQEENDKLAKCAKDAGYRFFIEKNIAGDPDASLMRKLLGGDMSVYKDSKELKAKIEAVRVDLSGKRAAAEQLAEHAEAQVLAEQERKDKERSRALKSERVLREENDQLRNALDKSLEANKQLMLHNYTEGRLANHPRATKLRTLIESANPRNKQEVDGILSQFREPARDPEDLEQVRARVRSATRGGIGPTAMDEETANPKSRSGTGHYGELGVSIGELRRLSGMGDAITPNGKG
jgi:hypothetical protein